MSLSKSEIARLNGAKSRGPVTPEGKARSAMNALRHGLTAGTLLLPSEDHEHYETLRHQYYARFDPADEFEADLVDQILAHRWGMLRVDIAQRDLFAHEAAKLDDAGADASAQLNAAFSNPYRDKTLALYVRYRSHYCHAYDRTLRNLERLQAARRKLESEAASAGVSEPAATTPKPGTQPPPPPRERNEPNEPPPPPPLAPVPAAHPPGDSAPEAIK
ncbi:MAG: hypothetical protein HYS04_05100 [Acidobacteria bacterium]|nr:hypothetical protein [Acidobacteriota bacterium]